TRSLGSASEDLRDDTWPIVEYLKLYPPSVGLQPDPPSVTSTQASSQLTSLRDHVAALRGAPPNGSTLNASENDVTDTHSSAHALGGAFLLPNQLCWPRCCWPWASTILFPAWLPQQLVAWLSSPLHSTAPT